MNWAKPRTQWSRPLTCGSCRTALRLHPVFGEAAIQRSPRELESLRRLVSVVRVAPERPLNHLALDLRERQNLVGLGHGPCRCRQRREVIRGDLARSAEGVRPLEKVF